MMTIAVVALAMTAGAMTVPTSRKVAAPTRRVALGSGCVALGAAAASLLDARAAAATDEPMRTSANMNSFAEVTGQSRGANLGAGSARAAPADRSDSEFRWCLRVVEASVEARTID